MLKIKFLFPVLFFIGFSLTSCNNEDDDEDDDINLNCDIDEILDLLDEVEDLADDYSDNPSTANCILFREALEDYLFEVKKCPQAPQSEINRFETALNQLDCN